MQLSQLIHGFFVLRRRRLAQTTQTNYQFAFRRLIAFFGDDRDVSTILATDIDAYLSHLCDDGLSDRSVFDNYAICSALWTFAHEEFKLPHVVRYVEKPAYQEKQIIPFTLAETQSILKAAEWTSAWDTRKGRSVRSRRPTWQRDLALIVMLLDTGLRITEACNLNVDDYEQDSGQLTVLKGKGNKERRVFLGDTAQGTLWRYMMGRKRIKPKDPVFVTRNKRPLHRAYAFHLFERIGGNAGVKGVHPHRFRHTFAIEFLRNGGNVFELQRILGHEDLETVQIYINLAQVDIERAQKTNSPADNWRL